MGRIKERNQIVFEKCLAQGDGPSRANFQQKIMCAFQEELFDEVIVLYRFYFKV
jgi:hypothetical protein